MTRTRVDTRELSLPEELGPFLADSEVYDSSSSPSAKTYYLAQGSASYFLKIHSRGRLARERGMSHYLSPFDLAPRVVFFESLGGKDYLVTEALEGQDGISKEHLDRPEELARIFGKSLAVLHSLPAQDCPYQDRKTEMTDLARRNIAAGKFDLSLIPEGFDAGRKRFESLLPLTQADALIHGDYCLPNILLRDFHLRGFVDLGNGGWGDSHYDLFWGLWTLNFNLGTTKYNDAFLEGYGAGPLDGDRIEFNRLLSGFT